MKTRSLVRTDGTTRRPGRVLHATVLLNTTLVVAGCAPSTPPAPVPRDAARPEPVSALERAIRLEDGRLAGTVIEGGVGRVEHLLLQPGPTTLDQLARLWSELDGLHRGLGRLAEDGAEPGAGALPADVVAALDAASDDVRWITDEVMARRVRWAAWSSLAAIEALWRPLADEHFAVQREAIARTADGPDRRDERDPPGDSDLREVALELSRLARECRRREEWDHAFAAEVQRAIRTTRPRPQARLPLDGGARVPFERYARGDENPRALRRALRALDDARAVLSDAAGVHFWNDGERARRLADEVARHAERAEVALAELP